MKTLTDFRKMVETAVDPRLRECFIKWKTGDQRIIVIIKGAD